MSTGRVMDKLWYKTDNGIAYARTTCISINRLTVQILNGRGAEEKQNIYIKIYFM